MKRFLLALAALAILFAAYVIAGLPSRAEVRRLSRSNPDLTSVMRQREQEAKRAGQKPRVQRSWVPISRMSRHLIHAVLASEDQKFFGHEGVDWDAVEKAIDEDRKRFRFVRGGSTITQQLAKNLYFTTHRSVVRKIREVIVARWLEEELGKKRILELYLNVIEWGDGIYGAQTAAQLYYGKPAAALDEVEAAGLAAMIPNPRRIHPRLAPKTHARAQRRVLWLMRGAGYLKREVGGLGTEPPPVVVEDEEEAAADEDPARDGSASEGPANEAPASAQPADEPPRPEASPSVG